MVDASSKLAARAGSHSLSELTEFTDSATLTIPVLFSLLRLAQQGVLMPRRRSARFATFLAVPAVLGGCLALGATPGCGPEDEQDLPSLDKVTQALGVTHTVCANGCNFSSVAACAIGDTVTAGDICLVQGGEYHETVEYVPGKLRAGLILRCDTGFHCLIDGDGVRNYGFNAYDDWVIEGFEITGTRSHAITAYRRVNAVRDCYIHDVQGRGINALSGRVSPDLTGVAERNLIVNTWEHGIACSAFAAGPMEVKNNVIVNAGLGGGDGILCSDESLVVHNTVDVRDRTQPYADPSPIGVLGVTSRFNVVAGGVTSLTSSSARSENLVYGYSSAAYGGTGTADGTDLISDPLFLGPEDYHLQDGSPAIDAATQSTETEDQESTARTMPPDIGALEWVDGLTPAAPRWPFRETVASPSTSAAPSMAVLDPQTGGPIVAYLDRSQDSLMFAMRLTDGTWRTEVVDTAVGLGTTMMTAYTIHPLALAVDPATGTPVLTWIKRTGVNSEIHVARRTGDGCGTDCTSIQWSGCGDAPIHTSSGTNFSLRLRFDPQTNRPTVGLWEEIANGCGSFRARNNVRVIDQQADDSWSPTLVASNATCLYMIPPGFDISFAPTSGALEVAHTETSVSSNFDANQAHGVLVVSTGNGGGFTPTVVPLGTGTATFGGSHVYVAMAHGPNDDLTVAAQMQFAGPINALGYVQRIGGAWPTAATILRTTTSWGVNGVDAAYDGASHASIAFTGDTAPWLGIQHPTRWDVRVVDAQRETGYWPSVVTQPAGLYLMSHQQVSGGNAVKFQSTGDPGGIDPAYQDPTACDQCPTDPNKTEPGVCGCGYAESPELSVAAASVAEGDAGQTSLTFTITASHACGAQMSVQYGTTDGTALAGSDYDLASGTLTLAAAETSGTVTVTVLGDTVYENAETLTLGLSSPSNAVVGQASATGTILNDDNAPTLSINDVTIAEGDSGTTNATFTVSLAGATEVAASVDYATQDDTATAGADYVAVSGSHTFAPGEASKTIVVQVMGETTAEPDETFVVLLANPTDATLADNIGLGTITNDDAAADAGTPDSGVDGGDAGADAAEDAATEAAVDAATEAAVDAATEAAVDAATEAAVDAATEAAVDAATEAAVDAATEAAVDAATEAAVDAATDSFVPDAPDNDAGGSGAAGAGGSGAAGAGGGVSGSGGTGIGGSGGAVPDSGAAGAGAAAPGGTQAASGDEGGCACRTGSGGQSNQGGWIAVLLGAVLIGRRRRLRDWIG